MIAIVVGGIAGKYLYWQIPRTVTAAELSLPVSGKKAAAGLRQLGG